MLQYNASEADRHICTLTAALQTFVLNTISDIETKLLAAEEQNLTLRETIKKLQTENDTLKSIPRTIVSNEKSK